MKVAIHEATVENGQIKLSEPVPLREHARVYVVIADEEAPVFHVGSPRLAEPERAGDFTMEVAEEPRDAGLR